MSLPLTGIDPDSACGIGSCGIKAKGVVCDEIRDFVRVWTHEWTGIYRYFAKKVMSLF
jgi:hypothetical protein